MAAIAGVVRRVCWSGHPVGDEELGVGGPVPTSRTNAGGVRSPDCSRPDVRSRGPGVRRPTERAMNETTVVHTDLDLLAERVEKAAALVQRLREEKQRLEHEKEEFSRRLRDAEEKLQGQDVAALVAEVHALRKEQREWQGERREVASRIEALAKKLERLET